MISPKRNKSIIIVAGMESDERSGSYAAEFFDDMKNILVIGVPNEKNEDDKSIKRKEIKLLKILLKENPQLIVILNENEKSKKINVEASKELRNEIMDDENISKNKKTNNYFIKNIIKETNIPYCYIEAPKGMDLAKRVLIQKEIIRRIIVRLFSDLYN
jgi:hypothetical protein